MEGKTYILLAGSGEDYHKGTKGTKEATKILVRLRVLGVFVVKRTQRLPDLAKPKAHFSQLPFY